MAVDSAETVTPPRIVVRAPATLLAPFVVRIMLIDYRAATDDVHFPDAGMTAAFHYRGDSVLYARDRAPSAAITGLFGGPRVHRHAAGGAVALVGFTPVGAAALLRFSADALVNSTQDLADVVGARGGWAELLERLSAAEGDDERFAAIERALLARLGDADIDSLASSAAARISAAGGRVSIERLATDFDLSASAFARRFRRQVGVAPRAFASIARLRHVLDLGRGASSLTELALDAGYFDQAHFIRDFRAMTGLTPGAHFGRLAAG